MRIDCLPVRLSGADEEQFRMEGAQRCLRVHPVRPS